MNRRRHIRLILVTALSMFVSFSCGNPSSDSARIDERQEVIKTYPFSDPDPVPVIARHSQWSQGAKIYPYFFWDKYVGTGGIGREWTVVRMENPYISVAVLPQVGGKVWGATEKTTNRDFLYTNHVLKFRQIAMRGPWTSGGIEFNFGIVGHSPSTASPVDCVTRNNPDGSVSCTVGATDLPSRTRWSVTIRLPKDRAYFETNGAWYNPTPYSQSYYYWSCAAIRTADDLKYIFPGRFQIGHDYTVPLRPWPLQDGGRDLSWYRNNHFGDSKSYFTVGEFSDFYGAWYQNSDSGFGHWALYDDMPGRKIWIWDQSRAGGIWVDLLTDRDGQYTEPQAGRLLNQSDHEFFKPNAADRWQEIWFPYGNIGPMAQASPSGVLNVDGTGKTLRVGLFALRSLDDDLVIKGGGKELYRERIRLKPAESFRKNLPVHPSEGPFVVSVGQDLVYASDPEAKRLSRPLVFKASYETDAEGLFLGGTRLEKERMYPEALQKYLACLAREPDHLRALSRTAELYARRGEYPKALSYAQKALAAHMYDPEANYQFGVISRSLGRRIDAKEALGWASRSMEYRSASDEQLAEICVVEGNFDQAVKYARRALDYNRYNIGACNVMITAFRKMGQAEKAREAIAQVLDIDPLDHLARFEAYLLAPNRGNLDGFKAPIRNESPHEDYLEMALYYMRTGCEDDAVTLLKNAPAYASVDYWLAYLLRGDSPRESDSFLKKASETSPKFVFPHREEEIPLFQWAMTVQPGDWKPKYYLGLIYWVKGRVEEARLLFERCDGSDFAPFYIARGSLNRELAPQKALADFERSVRMDKNGWRGWHALIDFHLKRLNGDQALKASREATRLLPENVLLQIDLAKSLAKTGGEEEAAAILDRLTVLPYEGAHEVHDLFAETHMRLGVQSMKRGNWTRAIEELEKSKEYPERLGTGKPFEPDVRQQDYLEWICYDKQRQTEKGRDRLKAVAEYTLRNLEAMTPNSYFGGLALRRLGERDKARKILAQATPPAKDILALIAK